MFNGQLKLSESTAARRRIYFHLVDATDGITAETGEAAGQPQISKNGAAFGNTTATLTAIGNGRYYVELTAGELDTLGNVQLRYKSANTAEAIASAQVVAYDPFSATSLGLSNLDATVSSRASQTSLDTVDDFLDTEIAAIKAKTDQLTFTIANKVDSSIQLAGDFAQGAADKVWSSATRTLTSFGTLVTDIWAAGTRTLTSISALSGDIWNALTSGMSTAGSIGKKLADWTLGTDNKVLLSTDSQAGVTIPTVTNVGTVTGNVNGSVGSLTTNNDKTGYSLSAAGIDAILDDAPAAELSAIPTTTSSLRLMIQFIFQYFRNRKTITGSTETLYKEDATTILGSASVTDDGATFTKGEVA